MEKEAPNFVEKSFLTTVPLATAPPTIHSPVTDKTEGSGLAQA